jgi:hypothetical protein
MAPLMTPSKSKRTRRKKRQKKKQKRFEGLRRKLEQSPLPVDESKIVVEPRGEVKMSDVLMDFVEPYIEFVDTKEDNEKLLMLALVAWNASFPPQKEQGNMIDEILSAGISTGTKLKADLKRVVKELIVRKKMHFSKYTRKIISFELVDLEGGDYYLTVASTLDVPPT